MRYNLYILIHICCCSIISIYGAFKDFVIENERDLERFGIPDTQTYDDDIGYDLLGEEYYGEVGGGCNAIDAFNHFDSGYSAEPNVAIEGYKDLNNGEIDANLLREVIRHIKMDPRFEHLWDQLSEENLILDYKRQDEPKKLSHHYIDVDEQNYGYDNFK